MPKKPRSIETVFDIVRGGNSHAFYVSRYWKDTRLKVLQRDNNLCQRCMNKFAGEEGRTPKLTKAKYVHHITPMEQCHELALDPNNLVSLCFECHEFVEGRTKNFYKPKPKLTKEKW